MYIGGHREILDTVLELLQEHSFYRQVRLKTILHKGLTYPDLPCGKYEIINNEVVMYKQGLCPWHNLLNIAGAKGKFKEIFQSHHGFNAFLHAMTYNPALEVKDIVRSIITYTAGCAFLSIYDSNVIGFSRFSMQTVTSAPPPTAHPPPRSNQKSTHSAVQSRTVPNPNSFWIGIILHIMMDSYSQSHTVRRDRKLTIIEEHKASKTSKSHKQEMVEVQFKYICQYNRLVQTEKDLLAILIERLKDDENAVKYVERRSGDLFLAFKIFKFQYQIADLVKKLVRIKVQPATNQIEDATTTNDIKTFQYYNNQSSLYHKKHDFMIQVKKDKVMYGRMIDECKQVLIMYMQCVEAIRQTPEDHLKISKAFVKNLVAYLLQNTFRISQENWNRKTGEMYKNWM
jgi:hypothetical protein